MAACRLLRFINSSVFLYAIFKTDLLTKESRKCQQIWLTCFYWIDKEGPARWFDQQHDIEGT